MFELLFDAGLVVGGMFVGWHFPQPEWAKKLQEKVVNWFKNQ